MATKYSANDVLKEIDWYKEQVEYMWSIGSPVYAVSGLELLFYVKKMEKGDWTPNEVMYKLESLEMFLMPAQKF